MWGFAGWEAEPLGALDCEPPAWVPPRTAGQRCPMEPDGGRWVGMSPPPQTAGTQGTQPPGTLAATGCGGAGGVGGRKGPVPLGMGGRRAGRRGGWVPPARSGAGGAAGGAAAAAPGAPGAGANRSFPGARSPAASSGPPGWHRTGGSTGTGTGGGISSDTGISINTDTDISISTDTDINTSITISINPGTGINTSSSTNTGIGIGTDVGTGSGTAQVSSWWVAGAGDVVAQGPWAMAVDDALCPWALGTGCQLHGCKSKQREGGEAGGLGDGNVLRGQNDLGGMKRSDRLWC